MNHNERSRWGSPEFWLVVIMLFTLTVLVVVILCLNVGMPAGVVPAKAADILEYRRSILTVIITAFGAWVGAGAAYFFGRENLREAANSLLQMHQSPADRLEKTQVRDLPRRSIDWTVKLGDTVATVISKVDRKDHWFITMVKDDGSLADVVHEDAIWRFITAQSAAGVPYNDLTSKTMAEVTAFIQSKPELKDYDHIYVLVKLDDSAGEVHDLMVRKDVYLGIITDSRGKPTHYVTTADMRMLLLRSL